MVHQSLEQKEPNLWGPGGRIKVQNPPWIQSIGVFPNADENVTEFWKIGKEKKQNNLLFCLEGHKYIFSAVL